MNVASICAVALSFLTDGGDGWFRSRLPAMQEVCEQVASEAVEHGMDAYLAISISWHESRFNRHAVSHCGAVGPMQVLPRYTCPNRRAAGCDLVEAGVKAYKRWRSLSGSTMLALCHYNNGTNCYDSGRRYARMVVRTADKIKKLNGG